MNNTLNHLDAARIPPESVPILRSHRSKTGLTPAQLRIVGDLLSLPAGCLLKNMNRCGLSGATGWVSALFVAQIALWKNLRYAEFRRAAFLQPARGLQ